MAKCRNPPSSRAARASLFVSPALSREDVVLIGLDERCLVISWGAPDFLTAKVVKVPVLLGSILFNHQIFTGKIR